MWLFCLFCLSLSPTRPQSSPNPTLCRFLLVVYLIAMLYELIAIVRPGSLNEVRDIARNTGTLVLRSGGVIRGFTNWGVFRLPRTTTKHQARYTDGHHFIMRFDAASPVQLGIRRTLALDPRMIRFSVIKLGDKLEEVKDVGGKVEWNDVRSLSNSI